MTIGTELDQAFYNLGQRITRLEKKEVEYPIENDFGGRIDQLEAELNDRIDELENFDPNDLRCDLETEIEDVRDGVNYMDDRIDNIECYKITEDEARDIAMDVVRDEIGDAITENINHVNSEIMDIISDYVNDEVSELRNRVVELEARLNKPSFTARALRWLREGPSIKEVATNWYAGIRRGS